MDCWWRQRCIGWLPLAWSRNPQRTILFEKFTHLLDVNMVLALLDRAHIHNERVEKWFDTPGLQWAMCAFTEARVLRFSTRPKTVR